MNGVSVPFAIMLYTTYMYEYKYVATLYCTYKKSFLFVLLCLFLSLYLNDSLFIKIHVQGLKLTLVPLAPGMQVYTGATEIQN